jgi:prepilin-type N-terminal cleavage/methylation domain-containing protein
MKRNSRRRRRGFTLLEVLLASVIALFLLGALYAAFDMVLKQQDAGRVAVSKGDDARAVINRMSIDLAGCLGPMPPKSGGGISTDETATTTTTAPSTTSTTTTSSTTTEGTNTESASTDSTSTDGGTQVLADVPFQGGLFGSSSQVTLFCSRVPPGLTISGTLADPTQQQPADLVRVSYYLHSSGRGLCRQVRPWVTADGVRNATDPDRSTEDADIVADDVVSLSFEYLDAGSWMGEWDGSQVKTDGKTAVGPPRAIKVVLTLDVDGEQTTVTHVFPVRAGVGLFIPPMAEEEEELP